MSRGRFVSLEGGEGAGKTTQIARLAEALRGRGLPVLVTREPGGSAGAEQIRRLLVEGAPERWDAATEALLHFAARADHLRTVIGPALAEGSWVLCDRFADSTMAYQGYGRGLGPEWIGTLQRLVLGPVKPDLTFILDLPVARGLARTTGRQPGSDRYERMAAAFHERVRAGFQAIAAADPQRCRIIDADRAPDAVTADLLALLEPLTRSRGDGH